MEDGVHVTAADLEQGEENLGLLLNSFKHKLGASEVCVALSDSANFRKQINPTYKARRADIRPPMILVGLHEYLNLSWPTKIKPGLEADDVLGIMATVKHSGRRIVVTEDKDLRTVPGWHWNPRKDDKPVKISEEQADFNWLVQTLSGDSTDGYPGCPKIGTVRAIRALQAAPRGEEWHTVVALFQKAGQSEEDAIMQARMARILRASDYDFKNKKPILWSPKSS